MKKFGMSACRVLQFALLINLIGATEQTLAQAPAKSINDFVLFGGSSGVNLSSSVLIQGGIIGSTTNVQTNGKSTLNSSIYSKGTINLSNSNTVSGNITSANDQNLPGNILSVGSSASVGGNIDVKGNILIGGGTVSGTVTHPAGTTYSGPIPAGGNITGVPTLPILPSFPAITSFSAAGSRDITSSTVVQPGSYGKVILTGKKTLTFSGPGEYVFESIVNSGNANDFVFDFNNTTTGIIKLFIHNDADLAKINSSTRNGGGAERIYTEVHGSGSSANGVAFQIANGSSGKASKWLGMVWVPNGSIIVGAGTGSSDLTGALVSAKGVNIQSGVKVNFASLKDDNVIFPYYPPPLTGKVNDLLGSELNSLYYNSGSVSDLPQNIFILDNGTVMIEVIAKIGKLAQLLGILQSPDYGLTNLVDNGPGSLIITGKYPVANLLKLDLLTDYIDYCRPLFPPIGNGNTGLTTTNGDKAIHADFVRNGYNVSGQGVKVGVISDSYNTTSGNKAGIDVGNGDLPGTSNPYNNLTPVELLKEYPFGTRSDEGRAMLQIIHDVAPKATLGFRTGFISAGDFAQGIREMQLNNYNVIVDDVTYITEPFFQDGVVANAVDEVTSKGVSYFSAAGNYGRSSYQNLFSPVAPPVGLTGSAHNFSGGDIYQNITLQPGTYTIVLQWEDAIYSLGNSPAGAANDLDIYLTGPGGSTLFGFNRNNSGGDPIEILPFTVTAPTQANIMIIRAAGSAAVNFKYVVFRGNLAITEYNSGTSTIVGQANSAGAITVGAVRYVNTPAYGVSVPVLETFSSTGGTPVNNTLRNKPDITGPDGVNTTVDFSSLNIEGDQFPNFFGTSAAAPHVAGAAALLIESKMKFSNVSVNPAQMRTLLRSTAVNMSAQGFDYNGGYGFMNAQGALATFASPTPEATELVVPAGTTPGLTAFTLKVNGNYFNDQTKIIFRGAALPTTFITSTQLSATVPIFTGNPSIEAETQAISINGNDGGKSAPLYFFTLVKKQVTIKADDKTKKFGEKIPSFTSSVLIDGMPISNTTLSLADLGLARISYSSPASDFSNTGQYFIKASRVFDPNNATDAGLLELYDYVFTDGVLTISKLPLTITPKDKVETFGNKITGIDFEYDYDEGNILQSNRNVFLSNLQAEHFANITPDAIAFVNGKAIVAGRTLTAADLQDMSFLASGKAIVAGKALVAGTLLTDMKVVEIDLKSIFSYQLDSAVANLVNGKAIVAGKAIVTGKALVAGKAIVAGTQIVNSTSINDTSNSNVVVIVDEADVNSASDAILSDLKSINLITGLDAGDAFIVPAALLSENFEISYGLGKLTILPAPLSVKAEDKVIDQNSSLPVFTSTITGFVYSQNTLVSGPKYNVSPAYNGAAGVYSIIPSAVVLSVSANYTINYIAGNLYVNPKGKGAKNVIPKLDCVDVVVNNTSGFNYVAHFSYNNPNATPVFIPIGSDNIITGPGLYSGVQPELFLPSGGKFDIYFDGNKIQWLLATYNGNHKSSAASDASSSSGRCSGNVLTTANSSGIFSAPGEVTAVGLASYPNPVTSKVRINITGSIVPANTILLSDITGRLYNAKSVRKITDHSYEMDMSNLTSGIYFIKLKLNNNFKTFRIVKL